MTAIKKGYFRVTEVISKYSPDKQLEKAFESNRLAVEQAGKRGTFMHLLAGKVFNSQEITLGDLVLMDKFDPRLKSWLDNLIMWHNNFAQKPTVTAHRYYSNEGKITGEVDFIFDELLIDLKTGAIPSTVSAQLGAYTWLSDENIKKVAVLHAPLDKKPKLVKLPIRECQTRWSIILQKHIKSLKEKK